MSPGCQHTWLYYLTGISPSGNCIHTLCTHAWRPLPNWQLFQKEPLACSLGSSCRDEGILPANLPASGGCAEGLQNEAASVVICT